MPPSWFPRGGWISPFGPVGEVDASFWNERSLIRLMSKASVVGRVVPDEPVDAVAEKRDRENVGPSRRRAQGVGRIRSASERTVLAVGGGSLAAPEEVDEAVRCEVGWSAIPRRPRSEVLLTARSSAVPVTAPSSTTWTWPVFFSITSHFVSERKARPIGVTKPLKAGRTPRFGTVIVGPDACASTRPVPPPRRKTLATAAPATREIPQSAKPSLSFHGSPRRRSNCQRSYRPIPASRAAEKASKARAINPFLIFSFHLEMP